MCAALQLVQMDVLTLCHTVLLGSPCNPWPPDDATLWSRQLCDCQEAMHLGKSARVSCLLKPWSKL